MSNFNQEYLNEKLDIGIDIDEECETTELPENQDEDHYDEGYRSKSVHLPTLPVEIYEN